MPAKPSIAPITVQSASPPDWPGAWIAQKTPAPELTTSLQTFAVQFPPWPPGPPWHSAFRVHASPMGSVGTHVPALQYLAAPHWLSVVHPAPASGTPASEAGPQVLVALSHTPETQTRSATAAEQVATDDGVVGSGFPLGIFGVQVPSGPVVMSHQSADGQFASVVHAVPHVPFAVSQVGASDGHCDEVVHWTHVLLLVSQMIVLPLHDVLSMHATQRFAFVPLVAHIVDRQSVVPSLAVQGPSPLA
jgi:hypothetical protein